MIETVANIFLAALAIYLVLGIVFSISFYRKGVHQIDDGVKSAPRSMKVLIFPGVVALWPILLKRVKKGGAS